MVGAVDVRPGDGQQHRDRDVAHAGRQPERHRQRRAAERLGDALRPRPDVGRRRQRRPAAIPTATAAPTSRSCSEGSHPRGFVITYLAEGATGTFFDTRLALANPTGVARARAVPLPEGRRHRRAPTTARWRRSAALTIDVDGVASMAERRLLDAHRGRRPGGRRSHDDVGHRRLRQPRRARRADAHGDDVVSRRRRDARQLRPVLSDPEPGPGRGRRRDHLSAAGAGARRSIRTYTVAPNSRQTIRVDDVPGLAATDVSAAIRSTNTVPIIVERAMYFTRPEQVFAGGHESAGVTAAPTRWFLAEGATGSFFNMFILIANPSTRRRRRADRLPADQRPDGHADARRRRQQPPDAQRGARGAGAGVGQHVDDRDLDQRRADRRRARDVVAGAGLQLAGGAQQPRRDRHRHALGDGGRRVGRAERQADLHPDRQHLDLRRHGARDAAVRGRHDGGEDVHAAGQQPHQRQRRGRVPGRGGRRYGALVETQGATPAAARRRARDVLERQRRHLGRRHQRPGDQAAVDLQVARSVLRARSEQLAQSATSGGGQAGGERLRPREQARLAEPGGDGLELRRRAAPAQLVDVGDRRRVEAQRRQGAEQQRLLALRAPASPRARRRRAR